MILSLLTSIFGISIMNLNKHKVDNFVYAKNNIEYLYSFSFFDILDKKKIAECIDLFLENNVYYDEFLELIDNNNTDISLSSIESILRKMDLFIPKNKEEAIWVILHYHILSIVNGRIDSLIGLEKLMNDVYRKYDFYSSTDKFLGDSHGIESLIGLYWEYEELKERPHELSCKGKFGIEAVAEIRKEIIKSATNWCVEYGKSGPIVRGH